MFLDPPAYVVREINLVPVGVDSQVSDIVFPRKEAPGIAFMTRNHPDVQHAQVCTIGYQKPFTIQCMRDWNETM